VQLENLRQKRNALRNRTEETNTNRGGPSQNASSRQLGADAAVLAAAARRRQQASYALSSSSSSSDCEEGDVAAAPASSSQELTAKLFAKLGIKAGGAGNRAAGFESDSSWASSPECSARIKAGVAGTETASGGVPSGNSSAHEAAASHHLQAQLEQAHGTIAALQQEVAAARAQADSAMHELRGAESYGRELEVRGSLALCMHFLKWAGWKA
jgi:hypothetical protein